MPSASINLDHNATTPPLPEVVALVTEVMTEGGNPSALHHLGRRAHHRMETARRQVAKMCQSRAQDVTFFGSATEANATLIYHFKDALFLRPSTEHQAILATRPGIDLAISASGTVDLAVLETRLMCAKDQVLLALMAVNNETGIKSDLLGVQAVVARARAAGKNIHYHVDAVQAPGKIPVDISAWGCDSLALSAHKMAGPQGVGALVCRSGFDLKPLILGGGQERRRRAGTENVAAIAGFGQACASVSDMNHQVHNHSRLETELKHINPNAIIVGETKPRVVNTTCLLTPGKSAATLLMQFDLAGIALSSGSACSSGKVGASHVLKALGYADDLAQSALRFSLGRDTKADDIDRALKVYAGICQ